MAVTQVVTGQDAASQVTAASQFNEQPADGFQYVLVKIRAHNESKQSLRIDANDFAVTGDSGIARRFVGAVAPDPALDGTVAAGETREGWVVIGAGADEHNLVLLYDSASIPGNWADGAFALEANARLPKAAKATHKVNKTGAKPSDPASLDQQVVTRDWAVDVLDVVTGQDVYALYPAADYRTTALGDADPSSIPGWIAFKIKVTNNQTGSAPAFFSPTAFTISDGDGNPVPDVLTLSAPSPDASGYYFPGASREGWVVFQLPGDYEGATLRFLPYRTDTDPRYIAWGSGRAAAPTPPPASLTEGQTARTTDAVNLRKGPSTDDAVVATLTKGTDVKVTGAAKTGDNYTWYPVKVVDTGTSGWVAANFLEPAG